MIRVWWTCGRISHQVIQRQTVCVKIVKIVKTDAHARDAAGTGPTTTRERSTFGDLGGEGKGGERPTPPHERAHCSRGTRRRSALAGAQGIHVLCHADGLSSTQQLMRGRGEREGSHHMHTTRTHIHTHRERRGPGSRGGWLSTRALMLKRDPPTSAPARQARGRSRHACRGASHSPFPTRRPPCRRHARARRSAR